MSKVLIISGPTASGKTSLAVGLAKKFNGELISADSRQIYLGLDIGTGKDHPKNIPLHLVDIINPSHPFSVAQYRLLALQQLAEIESRQKLPIIIGGTGQYLDALINPRPTFSIPPNNLLRYFLNKLSLRCLQLILKTFDFKTFNSLNHSDFANPRRLIRKIEIALFTPKIIKDCSLKIDDYLHISLTASNQFLYDRIDKRVEDRLKLGLIAEIKNLLKKYKWTDPGLNSLAYKEFKDFFNKNKTLSDCIQVWKYNEHAYVRRQKTWFKKMPNTTFIDITQPDFKCRIIKLISDFLKQK